MGEANSNPSDPVSVRPRIDGWVLWLGLFAALSPVLVDLVEHWIAAPWSRYSISFVVLLLLAARADSPRPASKRAGLLLLILGLAGQVFALAVSKVEIGRWFAAFAVLGVMLLRGGISLRAALLVLWVVPVPSMVIDALGGEAIVRQLYAASVTLLEPLGMTFEIGRRAVTSGAGELALAGHESGLLLATHMSGLAWYAAQRRGLARLATARLMAGFALLALPIQFAAVVASLVLLSWGSPAWTTRALASATWLLPCLVVVMREELPKRGVRKKMSDESRPD